MYFVAIWCKLNTIPLASLPSLPALPNSCTSSSNVGGHPILTTKSTFGTSIPMPKADVHTMIYTYSHINICQLKSKETYLNCRVFWAPIIHSFYFVMTRHILAMIAPTMKTLLSQSNSYRSNIFDKVSVYTIALSLSIRPTK